MKWTVPMALPLMHAVYERHAAGCCAHIVTDDGNVSDQDVEFCLEQALEQDHLDCIKLCSALAQMSQTQRMKLYNAPRPPFIPELIRAATRAQ